MKGHGCIWEMPADLCGWVEVMCVCMVGRVCVGEDGLVVDEPSGWGQLGESFECRGNLQRSLTFILCRHKTSVF